MLRQLLPVTAVGLTLAVAAPAMAQNYGYGQQQPRYDNNYGQQNAPYRSNNQYGGGYQQPYSNQGSQGYQQPYGDQGNQGYHQPDTRGGSYSDNRDRQDRRQGRELAIDIENALKAHGYDVGQVDGSMDTKSRAAIRAYERDANLPITGQPTPQLLSHIESHNVRPGGTVGSAGQVIDRFLGNR